MDLFGKERQGLEFDRDGLKRDLMDKERSIDSTVETLARLHIAAMKLMEKGAGEEVGALATSMDMNLDKVAKILGVDQKVNDRVREIGEKAEES